MKEFEIKREYMLDKLVEIFDENNKGFVYDRGSITSDEFLRYVCTLNGEPVGYVVLYPKNDFVVRDDYDVDVEIPENSIYIWHIITRKGYEGLGVAKTLINYIRKEYKNDYLYSIFDEHNHVSKKMHERTGFVPVCKFKKAYRETLETYYLARCDVFNNKNI